MVTPARTWFDDTNNLMSPAARFDQGAQYRETFLALVNIFIAAGYTPVLSTNSVNAPSAGNQILTTADVVWGNAAQVRSWIVFQSTAAAGGGSSFYVQLGAENTNTDVTPQDIRLRMATAAYTGGSTTAFPTGGTGDQSVQTGTGLLTWNTTPIQGQWSAFWTSEGDIWFLTKPLGVAFFTTAIIFRTAGGDNGRGDFRAMGTQQGASTTQPAFTVPLLATAGTIRGFSAIGGVGTNPIVKTIYTTVQNWNFGQESAERVSQLQPLYASLQSTGNSARNLGQWVDVWASCESGLYSGQLLKNETGVKRMMQIFPGIWLPVSDAAAQAGII